MRAIFLGVLMALAQPAATTQIVTLAPPERATVPASCPTQDPACAVAADGAGKTESGGGGPIIAGLLGLLVLGILFGRRRSGLPEVVS